MIFNAETKNDNNTLINKRNNYTRFELTANHQTPHTPHNNIAHIECVYLYEYKPIPDSL